MHVRNSYNVISLTQDIGGVLDILNYIVMALLLSLPANNSLLRSLNHLFVAKTKSEDMFDKKE